MAKLNLLDISRELQELSQKILDGNLELSPKIDDIISPFGPGILSGVLEISITDPVLYMVVRQLACTANDAREMLRAVKHVINDEKLKSLGTAATIAESKFIKEAFTFGYFGPCHKEYMLAVAAFDCYLRQLKGI